MTPATCTWTSNATRCDIRATHPYRDPHGHVWANLCGIHSLTLDTALAGTNQRALLSAWVRASGGAEKLAGTITKGDDL